VQLPVMVRANERDSGGLGVEPSLLEHVSPIEWDNPGLCGQYGLDRCGEARRRGPSA